VSGDHSIAIGGNASEIAAIEAAMNGLYWVSVNPRGRVIKTKHYDGPIEKEPVVEPDPDLFEYWPDRVRGEYVLRHVPPDKTEASGEASTSLYVQHIAGYGGRNRYERNQRLLQAAGFHCLRSKRGEDGRYWEIWYLPYLSAAEVIGDTLEDILDWLRTRIGPGTIALKGKTWGLSVD